MTDMNTNAFIRSQNFIGGRWCDAEAGGRLPVVNPADDSRITEVPDSTASDARAAP